MVLKIELMALQRGAQVAPQVLALLKQKKHGAVEGARAAAPFSLCGIQRDIRGFHERLSLRSMLRPKCYAHAAPHEKGYTVDDEGLLESLDQCTCKPLRFVGLLPANLDHGKLVARVSIGGVSLAQHAPDSTRR